MNGYLFKIPMKPRDIKRRISRKKRIEKARQAIYQNPIFKERIKVAKFFVPDDETGIMIPIININK